MWTESELDYERERILVAGQKAPQGTYRRVGTGKLLTLEAEGTLPASLDGRVACYIRVENTWEQQRKQQAQ